MVNKKKNKTSYILPSKKTSKSRTTKRKSGSKKLSVIQRLIIGVIAAAIVVVIIAVVCIFVFTPERMVKSKVEAMAADYYEEFLYKSAADAKERGGDIKTVFDKYKDTGLSPVSVRQLILHDIAKNRDAGEFIKKYCNENSSTVVFYPEEPYSKTSYHVEYSYSCDF